MKYESIDLLTRSEAESKLLNAQGEELCLLLLGLSNIDDWKWVQEQYLIYINHEDKWVASSAISGLGDLARLNGEMDKNIVVNELNKLSIDRPELDGKIQDALSDIDMFLKGN